MQRCWNKYGGGTFEWTVLEEVPSVSLLLDREQYHMDRVGAAGLFNLAPQARSPLGLKRSTETRAKMSVAKKGWRPSEETRRRMAAAKRGRSPSPETRAKMSRVQRERQTPSRLARTHCKQGHELAPANTYQRTDSNCLGCRTCHNAIGRRKSAA